MACVKRDCRLQLEVSHDIMHTDHISDHGTGTVRNAGVEKVYGATYHAMVVIGLCSWQTCAMAGVKLTSSGATTHAASVSCAWQKPADYSATSSCISQRRLQSKSLGEVSWHTSIRYSPSWLRCCSVAAVPASAATLYSHLRTLHLFSLWIMDIVAVSVGTKDTCTEFPCT